MSDYVPTIGLEVHSQLKTETKMFCDSKNDPDETQPNTNICPVCTAQPGTLPTISKAAVKHVLRVGVAVGGELADYTEFDRKNYFYPDIPKGYQISQYEYPLVSGGELTGVELTRIHLEEDTARSTHNDKGHSLVDFNRAGVPLMELVTEPVIHSAEQAGEFARELQLLLRTLNVSDADMEKGQLRVEANISVAKKDSEEFGTKVEVKNLNSFRSAEMAIAYEIQRHTKLIETGKGDEIVQETRGWDEDKQVTFSQRVKETSDDYRYFPEPDLPKLVISDIPEFATEELEKSLPELPSDKRERLKKEYNLSEENAKLFVENSKLAELFEDTVSALPEDESSGEAVELTTNYITSDLVGLMKNSDTTDPRIAPEKFAILIQMIIDDKLSSRGGKDTLSVMFNDENNDADPEKIAKNNNLLQTSSTDDLTPIVEQIIAKNPDVVEDYRGGKESALQFFIGQGMKETQGSANPQVLSELFKQHLEE